MKENNSQNRQDFIPGNKPQPQGAPSGYVSDDAQLGREPRKAPGSTDFGRKGGGSEQIKDYPNMGRSSHR